MGQLIFISHGIVTRKDLGMQGESFGSVCNCICIRYEELFLVRHTLEKLLLLFFERVEGGEQSNWYENRIFFCRKRPSPSADKIGDI